MEEVDIKTDEPWKDIKARHVHTALTSDPVDVQFLRHSAKTRGGLLRNDLRKKVWPKLLAVDVFHIPEYEGPPLNDHKERAQVMLDVNRCGRRIPEGLNETERNVLQEQLARIILRLLASNNKLCYYQGLHDVTLTVLLVVEDEDITFALLNVLVHYHLRDFLDTDMNYTKKVIGYISPLLSLVDEDLRDFLTRSECQYYFSLSWLITWFSHDIADAECVNRLFDFFLASHPIMPVYYSSALILSRRNETMLLECEMSSVHGLLSKLPNSLDFETAVEDAYKLFKDHPITSVASRGKIRINDSYLNWTHNKFERLVKSQRPDHILKDLTPSSALQFSSNTRLLLYSAGPIFFGILVYWLIKHDYHHLLYRIFN